MPSQPLARGAAHRAGSFVARLRQRISPDRFSSALRRLAHFWIVWSALLLVHEGGHALLARAQGLPVAQVSVGLGPALAHASVGNTEIVLRLVPLAGMTSVGTPRAAVSTTPDQRDARAWSVWRTQFATLSGGVLSTLALALVIAAIVVARERRTGTRWMLGRFVVADAVVITAFNFLPVPPLDGGRAVLATLDALRGAPLAGDALFWVQVGGFALAIVPMLVWTKWTARIDAAALRWCPPPVLS